jgi:putative transposase
MAAEAACADGDVSQFMKLLKQRFTIWFNKTHDRFGTLWAERFKSVLVEAKGSAVQTMAAYIDLNCVRAGLALDPKDYRFCGYAEAVSGSDTAQAGIRFIVGCGEWTEAQALYREIIFGTGAGAHHGTTIPLEEYKRVTIQGGKLPLATVLRCRVRYFTDGAVLGSRAFVNEQLRIYQQKTGRRERTRPHALPAIVDWGDLVTLRGLRQRTVS